MIADELASWRVGELVSGEMPKPEKRMHKFVKKTQCHI